MLLKNYQQFVNEKLLLSSYNVYIELVAKAYRDAELIEIDEIYRWHILSEHCLKMFKRMKSKVDVIFTTTSKIHSDSLEIDGQNHKIIHMSDRRYGPYNSHEEMKKLVKKDKIIYISCDNSDHPIFTLQQNCVIRAVHDYIVHILSDVDFSGRGEIASFNAHAKLAPKDAIPALFTEIVGQASYYVTYGDFPVQKICILRDFDFYNLGKVKGYRIENKKLIKN